MKTIISIIFLVVFVPKINAQNIVLSSTQIFKHIEAQKSLELDKSIHLFNSIDFLMIPQFGGLFNESFKYVEGITNLKNYYDDFDLGFNLGIKYKITDKVTFTSVYNIGMLKFEKQNINKISSSNIKVVLQYVF